MSSPPTETGTLPLACYLLVFPFLTRHPRSPSPPPQYDNHGRRVNTREYRYRKRLEDERHKLIEKAMKTIPNYHPPQDYRRPTKTQEKVYVPVNDYPEINFSMITNPLTLLTTLESLRTLVFCQAPVSASYPDAAPCGLPPLDSNPIAALLFDPVH